MASCVSLLWAGKLLGNMPSLLSPFSADFESVCGFVTADYREPKEICAVLSYPPFPELRTDWSVCCGKREHTSKTTVSFNQPKKEAASEVKLPHFMKWKLIEKSNVIVLTPDSSQAGLFAEIAI